MAFKDGEMVRLTAAIAGEVRVEDVPVGASVDLVALKAGDTDPLEVVVEVPAGRSKRGWNYTPQALQRIVGEVMKQGLPGFLGHQKAEDVAHEFPRPVTHWVGGLWRDGKAYFRGVIDAAAGDLKRWIRAKTVRTVSIFGAPTLATAGGETQVVDYHALSIDWTPLGRAGMPTAVVALGEMDSIEPAGAAPGGAPQHPGGELKVDPVKEPVTVQAALAALKAAGTSAKVIAGEMGWTFASLATDLGGEAYAGLQTQAKAVGEIAMGLGLAADAKPADVITAAKAGREAQVKAAGAEHLALVNKVVGEMVVAEVARPLVMRMLRVADNADEAAIKKAVGEMLESKDVKEAVASLFREPLIRPKVDNRVGDSGGDLKARRAAI